MLTAILFFACFPGLYALLTLPIRKKLQHADSAEQASKYKKQIKLIRLIVLAFTIVVGIAYTFYLFNLHAKSYNNVTPNRLQWIGTLVATYIVIRRNFRFPVTTTLADDVFGVFVLCLDAYEKSQSDESDKKEVFYEDYLGMRLSKKVDFYVVSDAIEIYSPKGAKRIYTDEDHWDTDTQRLMEKSRINLLVISDYESCIWEIEQSLDMLSKTIFIVDDIEQYNKVRERMAEKIQFPEILPTEKPDISFFYFDSKGNCPVFHITRHSREGYKPLADIIIYNAPKAKFKGHLKAYTALDVLTRFR